MMVIGRLMNMRLRIALKICANDVFLYEGYQDDVLLYFRTFFNNKCLNVTDFLAPRKIETDKGIWLVNKASLIVCSPFLGNYMKEIISLPGEQLKIQGNIFTVDNVKLCRQITLHKGVILSGVYSHDNSDYLEYEKSPELFSEYLRLNLIEIYKTVNNQKEPDDKRFFVSLNKGYQKQYILGKPFYKGTFEIYGSSELCDIFNQYFVTGKVRSNNTSGKEKSFSTISERG